MLHRDFDFYIHVDAKLSLATHQYLTEIPNVYLIKKRVDVQWAAYSTMQAVFNSVQEILDSGREYDFITLMSGQDYPIKTTAYMQSFYEARKGKLLIKYRAFDGEWKEGNKRIHKYFLTNFKFRGQTFLENLVNKIIPKRIIPNGVKFYGSSMFWALSPEALKHVLEMVKNVRVKRFFYFSWAPDEFLIQTILMNSPFAAQVVNENCHFYKHPPKTASPKNLVVEDLEDILATDRIIARKFIMKQDSEILDKIDIAINNWNKTE
jgi:hypothetical protein